MTVETVDNRNRQISDRIQMLRGLAIIAVVFIHNTPIGMTQVLTRPFWNVGVGLFLFLSGMLSDAGKWKPGKRLAKVLIPYAIWTLFYVLLFTHPTPTQLPGAYLRSLLLGDSAAIMYYIFVYCEFTLLLPLIDRLAKSKYRYWGFVIAPAEIVVMRMIPTFLGISMSYRIEIGKMLSCLGWFTYFYLGYMLGNGFLKITLSTKKLLLLWAVSIVVQIGEGYCYYRMGDVECATPFKLSALLTGSLFVMLAYRFVYADCRRDCSVLKKLGDISFGVYFSHIAVMTALKSIPSYGRWAPYPVNAIVVIVISSLFVFVGRKILGKNAKYLAL